MKETIGFSTVTASNGGKKSSRKGVSNVSTKTKIQLEILNALNDNKGAINDILTKKMKSNPLEGLRLFIELSKLIAL